jgi:DsbC/DsbD-like thiol-disulfide interchange protein
MGVAQNFMSTPWQSDESTAPELPPGLQSARLLQGWTDADGDRIMALELQLEPGWKTYWRTPGDTGLPPHFEWRGSENLADVTFHWPAPQPIKSGNKLEMGYHNTLVLPFIAHATDAEQPVEIAAQIELGLCESICVPVSLNLTADPTGTQTDPAILTAMKAEPTRLAERPVCHVTPLEDGMRLSVDLPLSDVTLAAIELMNQPRIWVSSAELVDEGQGPMAVVEMVGPSGKPFDIDPAALRTTLVSGHEGASSAVDMVGCNLQD